MKSKDVNLSKLMTLDTDQTVTGYKQFTQSIQAPQFIKINGTNDQILLANGDTIDKDKLAYEPIENATYQSIAYGMYERLIWGTLTTQNNRPKFTGTQHNIPINAVMFAQKVIGYPICWNGAIPIDCFINPNGNVIINTQCQLHLPDDFCVQFCDSYAIYNQSS
ncbi:MAG: hypothetical protein EZS28_045702 [Streblomastix strix]|uniref:Uncharacterized protein n=1 Tax=Streblomastix strix TaxID=222440 RepID=A0A5J4TLP6_9EUKA|nr:MAG: hypothetical protein EZS28_045702 [Streblomastix strix]